MEAQVTKVLNLGLAKTPRGLAPSNMLSFL